MKAFFLLMLVLLTGVVAQAQFTKASLQASGLTCSMCSKAVKTALEEVPFVEKVQVDIKNQQYNLSFKEGSTVDFDALSKAVEDAGFSIAGLKVTASLNNVKPEKDEHIQIGTHLFHFLNASGQQLDGTVTFTLVDKSFVSPKEFKKWSSKSKMACVQTGRTAQCCVAENMAANSRIYHVVI